MTSQVVEERIAELKRRLQVALPESYVEVLDESHFHAGHAGSADGASHFAVTVSAAAFKGKTAVQRHQLVYAAVGDLIPSQIHALRIEAGCMADEQSEG